MVHRTGWRAIGMAALMLAIVPSMLLAEPYWIAYEGNEYPEDVGWRRHYGNENGPYAGGAVRSLQDGVFTLDSMRHDQIFDFYEIQRPIDPGPGEMFVAEWRVLVEPVSDPGDAGVVVARDDPPGHVFVEHAPDDVLVKPGNVLIGVAPGAFHSFRIESHDMDAFELFVDGQLAHSGFFDSISLLSSFVNFGDGVQGARSLTHWDYFRFGVVPEPGCGLTLLSLAGIFADRLRFR